jgi:hypothetical protein
VRNRRAGGIVDYAEIFHAAMFEFIVDPKNLSSSHRVHREHREMRGFPAFFSFTEKVNRCHVASF